MLAFFPIVVLWCADAARISTPNNQTEDAEDPDVGVDFLFTRHGMSCANAVQKYSRSRVDRWIGFSKLKDPRLTSCGSYLSTQAGEALQERGAVVDLVVTSSMRRAILTAAYQYPGATIIPIPYISEKGNTPDNIPISVPKQQGSLENDVLQRIDWKWMEDNRFNGKARSMPSYKDFLEFMAEEFLPSMSNDLRAKRHLTIAVVTHSRFLFGSSRRKSQALAKCAPFWSPVDGKPRNNQVFKLSYKYRALMTLARQRTSVLDESRDHGFFKRYVSPYLQKPTISPNLAMTRTLDMVSADCEELYAGSELPSNMCTLDYGRDCQEEYNGERVSFRDDQLCCS
eukprot:TRINITY_DN63737_c0_g1_i1.p1 TRINITY_DN63737_c0_g1~~TRINITY_DN63737_c0_g1_i1.p1  ORF type:complete len:341 (+),score=21.33 TRINITY_DN63737_c0_g1_i1:81-1103(+)